MEVKREEIFPGARFAIHGQIPIGVYVLLGAAGGGKRQFSYYFTASGLKERIPAVMFALKEAPEWIMGNLSRLQVPQDRLGHDLLRIIDGYSWRTGDRPQTDLSVTSLGNLTDLLICYDSATRDLASPRISLDSISSLVYDVGNERTLKFLETFVARSRKTAGHTLATLNSGAHEAGFIEQVQQMIDGIIEIRNDESDPLQMKRAVRYKYVRGANYDSSWFPFELGDVGIIAVLSSGSKSLDKMLTSILRVAMERYAYRFAWIGFVDEKTKELIPAASHGFSEGYLASVKIKADDSELGRGPTGRAVKTGRPAVQRNILSDPDYAPWREEATRRGYKSSAAIPIIVDGRPIAVLNLYSGRSEDFDEPQLERLGSFAREASMAIKTHTR
jgi:KaiC/GvpD/RAD55 family RecA-like ATPase